MVLKTDGNDLKTKYSFNRKGGRSIIDHKPVFSPDGESVAIIVEKNVRVYSIQTGDCVRILEPDTAVSPLIAIDFPLNEQHNLYGCSEDGSVTIWTWENGVVLREKNLRIPHKVKLLTFDLIDSNECFVTGKKKGCIVYFTYSLKTGELMHEYAGPFIKDHGLIGVAIGWSNGERFAAITNGTKCVYIQNLIQPHFKSVFTNLNQIRVLTVAAHPQDSCIAIGDALGRAVILRGNLFKPSTLAREVLHWSRLPLPAVTFSLQGSYMLTGGFENVLVKWSIGAMANKANEKQFIPRLPGSVKFVIANSTHIIVSLTSNSLVIANAQMRVVSTILECGGLSSAALALGSSLVYHKKLNALLLGGRTGYLQLYSTVTDKVLYNIDVTQQNRILPSKIKPIGIDTEVTCVAVSANGKSLVTSEYRNDGITYTEEQLKFWTTTAGKNSPFTLNTCVNLSHGGCNVISLALDNLGHYCVSAGGDRKFRVWKRDIIKLPNKSMVSWNCLTACYYSSGVGMSLSHDILNKFKSTDFDGVPPRCLPYMVDIEEPDIIKQLIGNKGVFKEKDVNAGIIKDNNYDMGGVAISQDGSLIAAWFGCKLTLWDSHLCSLRTTLSHTALQPKGVDVRFGNGDAAHYLVCTTSKCLAVWSLLSLSVKWIVKIQPACLTSDPFTNKMAVVTTSNDVFVFTPHNSTPILYRKQLIPASSGVLKYCTFAAGNQDDIKLYMMRNNSEIYCLEPELGDNGQLEIISQRNLPQSNFSALIAEQKLTGVQTSNGSLEEYLDTNGLGKNAISQFLSAAPHMMPPVGLLCSSFLQKLSGQEEAVDDVDEETMEVDLEASSDEDELAVQSSSPKKSELWTANYANIKEKKLQKINRKQILDDKCTIALFAS